jgi:hypothetical protein
VRKEYLKTYCYWPYWSNLTIQTVVKKRLIEANGNLGDLEKIQRVIKGFWVVGPV